MGSDTILETADLALEPLLPSHTPELYDGLRDVRIYCHISQRPPASLAELSARFFRLRTRRSPDGHEVWLNWAVRRKRGEYVGWLQATLRGDHADVAYIIFPAFWRLGYASHACQRLLQHLADEHAIHLASATVDTENSASIRLLESLGFTRVSTQPASDMPDRLEHRYEKRL